MKISLLLTFNTSWVEGKRSGNIRFSSYYLMYVLISLFGNTGKMVIFPLLSSQHQTYLTEVEA